MLKAQLHIHVRGDPHDKISYTPKELIDEAARLNYQVLAFTCHNKVIFNQELKQYAQDRNILLIPGVERTIHRKHVLIYNLTEEESQQITSFKKLHELKLKKQQQKQPFLVIAAHPFHLGPVCLRNKILKHFHLFDAWECSFFYLKNFNPNKKTVKFAKNFNKPIIGSSDVHRLNFLRKTHSLIDSKKDIASVFQAIKNNQVKINTRPLSFFPFIKILFWAGTSALKNLAKQKSQRK